jgi:hypothetical protein
MSTGDGSGLIAGFASVGPAPWAALLPLAAGALFVHMVSDPEHPISVWIRKLF